MRSFLTGFCGLKRLMLPVMPMVLFFMARTSARADRDKKRRSGRKGSRHETPPANADGINHSETQIPGPKLRKPYGRAGMSASACLRRLRITKSADKLPALFLCVSLRFFRTGRPAAKRDGFRFYNNSGGESSSLSPAFPDRLCAPGSRQRYFSFSCSLIS